MVTSFKSPMVSVIEYKLGDTVMMSATALKDDDTPFPLTGVTVKAQVRAVDETSTLLCDLDYVAVSAVDGTYELWEPASAPAWAVGEYKVDVQYESTVSGRQLIRSTETFYIRIIQDVTEP